MGLKHRRTRPYSPQTNGKAERFIQTALREWAYATHWPDSGGEYGDRRDVHLILGEYGGEYGDRRDVHLILPGARDNRVPVDDQEVVPVSEGLMGGWY
jgi:transposase InsO family protein